LSLISAEAFIGLHLKEDFGFDKIQISLTFPLIAIFFIIGLVAI